MYELSVQIRSPHLNVTVVPVAADANALIGSADEVHLDPALVAVPDRLMIERCEVELAAEFVVDPLEEVLVEGGGHAERIVVGEQQVALRFDEVGAEQEKVALGERRANAIEELRGRWRIEVADIRAEQQDQDRAVGVSRGDRRPQPLLVGRPVPHHRDVSQPVQPLFALLERLRRNVDQVDVRAGTAALERFGEEHDLLAAAASELDDRALAIAERRHDRPRRAVRADRSRIA